MTDKNKFYRFLASIGALVMAFGTALLARLQTAFQNGILEPIDWLIMVLFVALTISVAYWAWDFYPKKPATKKKTPPAK